MCYGAKSMKHYLTLNYVLILVLCSLATTAKADSELVKDMIKFDQLYIPVLALTSLGEVQGSRVAFASLEPVWLAFKNKYYSSSVNDPSWKKDFDKVNGYIKSSKNIRMKGTNLSQAHEQLEHVRVIFMGLRNRNGINYYIDHLTRFHEPMENIVLTVKGKTADTLSNKDVDTIKQTLPGAIDLWHKASDSRFDANLYGFNKNKVKMLKSTIKKEQTALMHLQQAIKENNKNRIIKTSLAIKPNFAKIFKAFGHFSEK